MLKIKDMYEKLSRDEEVIFQVKTKNQFLKIINEMRSIFDKWDFIFIEDYLNYKDTYFILGNWRDGMFELRTSRKDDEHQIHILADYKEDPMSEELHLLQISNLIKIMDKYRSDFVVKKLYLNKNFDLVEKVDDK